VECEVNAVLDVCRVLWWYCSTVRHFGPNVRSGYAKMFKDRSVCMAYTKYKYWK